MEKTTAVIRQVGDEFCVFSKEGKNLGCSTSREGAEERLRQVEFFKHKGSSSMDYFDNFTKAYNASLDPKSIGQSPSSSPKEIKIASELSVTENLRSGTLANRQCAKLLDNKDHFPVTTPTQAQSSMVRVLQLTEVPNWYNGTLAELRQEVYDGVTSTHPDIQFNVRIPVNQVVALSDGQVESETGMSDVQNPNDVAKHNHVPQVKRRNLSTAEAIEALNDEDVRKVVAGRLMEMIDSQMNQMVAAKDLANKLLNSGISAEEFDTLSTYVQSDILKEMIQNGSSAKGSNCETDSRRRTLIDRMASRKK